MTEGIPAIETPSTEEVATGTSEVNTSDGTSPLTPATNPPPSTEEVAATEAEGQLKKFQLKIL